MRTRARLAILTAVTAGVALTAPVATAAPDPTPVTAPDVGTQEGSGPPRLVEGPDGELYDAAELEKLAALPMDKLATLSDDTLGLLAAIGMIDRDKLDDILELRVHDCTINGQPATVEDGRIEGTDGDDTVRCTQLAGVDSIDGLAGDDTITVDGHLAERTIRGGDGKDTITVTGTVFGRYEKKGQVLGGDGNDSLNVYATDTNGVVDGEAGDDTIRMDEVTNGHVEGGDGDDHLRIGTTMSVVYGGPGDDLIEGTDGASMRAGAGSYTTGQDGIDTCRYTDGQRSDTLSQYTVVCEHTSA
jgi:Ca2+-binding RTX toxin-like protein